MRYQSASCPYSPMVDIEQSHINVLTSVHSPVGNASTIIFSKQGITLLVPSPRFAPYVDAYTLLQGIALPANLRLYPQNHTEIWLHFADVPTIQNAQRSINLPRMSLSGPQSTPPEYHFQGYFDSLHIAFRLGGEVPFLPQAPMDFGTEPLALDQILTSESIQQLHDLVAFAPLQRILLLESLLATWFDDAAVIASRTQHGLHLIQQTWGNIKVTDVAHALNLSERQLLRSFKSQTGLPPNHIIRMVRFCGTLQHINQEPQPNVARIAHEHGYTDQSHLIRDFIHFSRLTPAQFLKRRVALGFLHEEWLPYV